MHSYSVEQSYHRGHRVYVKSSEAMGLCESVDAPCMYLTVLRHPVARMMSLYKYACLAGAEQRRLWAPEWKRAGTGGLYSSPRHQTHFDPSFLGVKLYMLACQA